MRIFLKNKHTVRNSEIMKGYTVKINLLTRLLCPLDTAILPSFVIYFSKDSLCIWNPHVTFSCLTVHTVLRLDFILTTEPRYCCSAIHSKLPRSFKDGRCFIVWIYCDLLNQTSLDEHF